MNNFAIKSHLPSQRISVTPSMPTFCTRVCIQLCAYLFTLHTNTCTRSLQEVHGNAYYFFKLFQLFLHENKPIFVSVCVCSAMLLSIHLGSSRKSLIPVTSLDWRFLLIVPVFRQQVVLQQVRSLYGDGSMRRTPCRAMGACAKQHRGCSMQWVH